MSEEMPAEPVTPAPMSSEKKIILGLLAVIALGVIWGVVVHNDNRSKALAIVAAFQNAVGTNTPAPVTQNTDPNTDKSFHLDSVTFSDESGTATAHARITNQSDQVKTAVFAITIFKSDGVTIAQTLVGSAQAVQPGQTETVAFFGQGALPTEKGSYAFQVTIES